MSTDVVNYLRPVVHCNHLKDGEYGVSKISEDSKPILDCHVVLDLLVRFEAVVYRTAAEGSLFTCVTLVRYPRVVSILTTDLIASSFPCFSSWQRLWGSSACIVHTFHEQLEAHDAAKNEHCKQKSHHVG